MDITVIIPFYQSALLIERCLRSVLNQKGGFKIEIIAVDDGSTDESVEIIKNMNISNLQLIHQENQGPAVARNKGIEAASGIYLAFLDADDYWKPSFLFDTINFLEKHPDAIAVSTGQLHKIPGKPDAVYPKILRSEPGKYTDPFLLSNFFEFWTEHNHVCTGSVLMRTKEVKLSGGQCEELRITEDLEFWAYLATFGKWGFIPKVLFVSDGGEVSKRQGWWNKNFKRWQSAPAIEAWEKRITKRLLKKQLAPYQNARGRIARNLVYSMIMSNRLDMAKRSVKKYGTDFPDDKMSAFLIFASRNTIIWKTFCKALIYREKSRIV